MSDPHRTPAPAPPSPAGGRRRPMAKIRHDLRTPVNHIIGFSEMLLEEAPGRLPETFIRDLQKIRNGGEQLLALVNLHLSDKAFPESPPDLHQLCHELRTPVNHIIGYSELLIDQALESGHIDLQGDLARINAAARTWLALMEENLLGEATLGAPNPPAYAETETFLRIEQAFTEPLLEQVPLLKPLEGRLLLADDDEPNRELLRRRLEKLGYEVTACGNGLEALQRLGAAEFDLVLLDLLMPGLDGREVLARIKSDPAWRHLPVIMISAMDQVEGIVRCIELGAEDYVAKPFNSVFLRARIGAALEKKRLRDREVSYLLQIQKEKQRSDELLNIILPQDVAEELKSTSAVQPRRFENVGVLFCDLVGFTAFCDQHAPEEIVAQLQQVVEAFEHLALRHGLEKIKTIGDSFMCTAGLRTPLPNPALSCVRCAWDMVAAAGGLPPRWQVRVGVAVGPVVAGVVGRRKYQYDVWGDTVNLAARMEAAADPGSVCVPAETWSLLEGLCGGSALGRLDIKGKGRLELFMIGPPHTPM
ncbi:MAG TPA: adenylate/guanylate cyclase domain-containing protein [Candidatus Acidoferrum sp.]|jgi:adenylate cyclase|nr:adenylate/guanylate cyclase domain-containing protein [Candidatus Acidoferrum sp.]